MDGYGKVESGTHYLMSSTAQLDVTWIPLDVFATDVYGRLYKFYLPVPVGGIYQPDNDAIEADNQETVSDVCKVFLDESTMLVAPDVYVELTPDEQLNLGQDREKAIGYIKDPVSPEFVPSLVSIEAIKKWSNLRR